MMTPFKSLFARFSHKSTPVVATNSSLDSWCGHSSAQSTRFIQKMDICTALCVGDDAWGMPLGEKHHHTLLQVSLAPAVNGPDASEDTLLIERVLSTGGAYHSATPIPETFSTGGTLFHPDVHDRICAIADGPPTALAHELTVERTFAFADCSLTLAELAQILAVVSRATELVCDGGDCKFQSRSFAFTCMAAFAPSFPPREAGGGACTVERSSDLDLVDDSTFELSAEAFLVQAPWLVRDGASVRALKLMRALKEEPRERAKARLYH